MLQTALQFLHQLHQADLSLSSPAFLFLLLPIILLLDRNLSAGRGNICLLLFSLFLYACWAEHHLRFFGISILANYLLANIIAMLKSKERAKLAFFVAIFSVALNITAFIYFKYIPSNSIVPMLAISFMTFRAISLALDTYFGVAKAPRNIVTTGLYLSFFPTMVMGPIMRYGEFDVTLSARIRTKDGLADGIKLFVKGLSKKIILAAPLGLYVDKIWTLQNADVAVATAWFGAFAYCMQLYFDFSGYSDMAIGLGRMFGINVPENFNYPYVSRSVAEFWRRWHITLGTWFRDYLYTPLFVTLRNRKMPAFWADITTLFVLWLLVGIWHGSGIKFAIYGIMWFIPIAAERIQTYISKMRRKAKGLKSKDIPKTSFSVIVFQHAYVLLAVLLIQVVFRAPGLREALRYYGLMFTSGKAGFWDGFSDFITYDLTFLSIVCVILSIPIFSSNGRWRNFHSSNTASRGFRF
jgi:alginate O-acetyltransferase complex protein AlgI